MFFLLFLLSRLTCEGNAYIICASGDIHGDMEVMLLIKDLVIEQKCDKVVFTGDFVDRGPNSMEVLREVDSFITAGEGSPKVYPLLGNHETASLLGIERYQANLKFTNWGGQDSWLKLWGPGGEARRLVQSFQLYHLHKPHNCSPTRSPATLFMHSGANLPIMYSHAEQEIATMEDLQQQVLKLVHRPAQNVGRNQRIINRRATILYYRALVNRVYKPNNPQLCEHVKKLLDFSGAVRLVIGHISTHKRELLTECHETIFYIDIGMHASASRGLDSMGALLVIRTEPDEHNNEAVVSIESHVRHRDHPSVLAQTIFTETAQEKEGRERAARKREKAERKRGKR